MFKRRSKSYRVFEGLRVATLSTFVGGFIDAFTFNTQEGRFASIQTGNLLYLIIHLAEGELARAMSYLVPIIFFILGQFLTYFVKKWLMEHGLHWHLQALRLAIALMLLLAIMTPYVSSSYTIAGLAFFASMQIGIFKRVRGINYASFMMTGNIMSTSRTIARAIDEKDKKLLKQAFYTTSVIISFILGVALSTWASEVFQEYSLYLLLIPLLVLHHFLLLDTREKELDKA